MEKITPERSAAWSRKLKAIAARPLEFCPPFPAIADRWEAWWRFEAKRPLLLASAAKRTDIRRGKAFDLIQRPEEWLKVRRAQIEATHYAGEAIPSIRADIGPVATAAFLGAPTRLSEQAQTSWQEPIIEDWRRPPSLALDPKNAWLRLALELSRLIARDAAGRYLVCFPDLAGAIDVLSNLRGPDRLCMDLFDHRAPVKQAAMQALEGWEAVFAALHETVLGEGAGVTQWLGAWSNTPHTVPTCDFNALIGPEEFADVCLPTLREQARRAGRCAFHLDGPAAARHAEALAREPAITAVQYTPGAGTPSALAKLDMFRLLQQARKPLYLFVPLEEVDALCDQLDPRGLALAPAGIRTPQEADEVVQRIEARFKRS